MKRRRLGQHYLVDQEVIRRMMSLADIKPTERVLEIGTGRGALTKELVGLGASLVGYEVDKGNFEETRRAVHGTKARILLADAFNQSPEFDVLVSSLPYSASATFVQWLSGIEFNRAIVLMQEDFVKKILAPPGARDYRGISALAQLCFEVEVLDRVKRASFSPQPRVSSVIVSFVPRLRVSKDEVSQITRLFTLRRRRADSALAQLGMKHGGSFGRRRVYALRPEEIHLLCLPTNSTNSQ
jgi:16S rRNA (adenine1518-N6/adenine1519-N6)-dimethyltransferase